MSGYKCTSSNLDLVRVCGFREQTVAKFLRMLAAVVVVYLSLRSVHIGTGGRSLKIDQSKFELEFYIIF